MTKIFIFIGILSLMLWSCSFENEQDYFNSTCNTENMTYDSVAYVFDVCIQCHSEVFTERDGIEMDSYKSVVESINTGLVLPAIKHEGRYLMPYNLPKLPNCGIKKVEAWINDGMPK